jgi:pseudouridine synthase
VCERLIETGHVEVNGQVVTRLPIFVDPRRDRILVDGRPIARHEGSRPRRHYLLFHKPANVLTARIDEPGADRTTVLDLVNHPEKPRLFPVGRLDFDTTGLVLLTNDGDLTHRLTHPRYGVSKTYHAVIKGLPDDSALARLEREIHKAQSKESRRSGSLHAPRVELKILRRQGDNTLLEITLNEGRNRHVRELLAGAGCPVKKLTQVRLGPLELRGVALGAWRELDRSEVAALRRAAKGGREGRSVGAPGPARAVRADRPHRAKGGARSGKGAL